MFSSPSAPGVIPTSIFDFYRSFPFIFSLYLPFSYFVLLFLTCFRQTVKAASELQWCHLKMFYGFVLASRWCYSKAPVKLHSPWVGGSWMFTCCRLAQWSLFLFFHPYLGSTRSTRSTCKTCMFFITAQLFWFNLSAKITAYVLTWNDEI